MITEDMVSKLSPLAASLLVSHLGVLPSPVLPGPAGLVLGAVPRTSLVESFHCKIDECDHAETSSHGWQQGMLHHFHSVHDLLLDGLLVQSQPSGRYLRAQHMFRSMGQCGEQDCLGILGVVEGGLQHLENVFRSAKSGSVI